MSAVQEQQTSRHETPNREQLAVILERHRRWAESGRQEGEAAKFHQADLRNVDLRKVDLRGADLRQANLSEADLRGADLRGANLNRSILKGTNLRDSLLNDADLGCSELTDACLQDSRLQNANLEGVLGLLPGQLAGSDLSNAKLPPAILEFKELKTIEEISKLTQTNLIAVLAGCVYSWLTVATTLDSKLVTDSASSPLPIIGTPVPITAFYVVAPLILLVLYVHLHLYLQRMWDGLSALPAVFPDGRTLDRVAYPWLLNSLARRGFRLLRDEPLPLSRVQTRISKFISWWIVPITLLIFWGDYLSIRKGRGTFLHILMLAVCAGAGLRLSKLAATLRREKEKTGLLRGPKSHSYFLGITVALVFSFLSYQGIYGVKEKIRRLLIGATITEKTIEGVPDLRENVGQWRVSIPKLLGLVHCDPFADLRGQDVSTKPENWKPEDIESVKGANLTFADLKFADAVGAFFAKADLSRADLRHAELFGADLRAAILKNADLRRAGLRRANLSHSDLAQADLSAADLTNADLSDASLEQAKMRGADFSFANLGRANFGKADLRGATFWYVDLSGANLSGALLDGADFHSAKLAGADLSGVDLTKYNSLIALIEDLQGVKLRGANLSGLQFGRQTNLQGADLSGANLTNISLLRVNLRNADLRRANFLGAKLMFPDLSGAGLRGATGLTQDQVEHAIIDETTRLPKNIRRPSEAEQARLKGLKNKMEQLLT